MSTVRTRTAAALTLGATALLTLAACAEGPTAPAAASAAPTPGDAPALASASSYSTSSSTASTSSATARGVLWSSPAARETASRVIGPEGGSVSLSGGVRLVVPRGAVASNLTFTVTRLPGRIVAYEFQPHGVTFRVPVVLEHATRGIDTRSLDAGSLLAAHFQSATALDQTTGTAAATEFAPASLSWDRSTAKLTLPHFSGWMVSTGRTYYR